MSAMTWPGRAARAVSLTMLAYWALFALLSPVTVFDAHVYNLGRLPLAELAGLFGNPYWTTSRQLLLPWTFDAVHLPFLHLGFGFGLPSFLCLIGTLRVAWPLLAQRLGEEAAWMGVLALLALPTLAFQSVVTKNDVAVLFGVAVWLYAMQRLAADGRTIHLFFCALAIGFTFGVKTTGLCPAVLCFASTLWKIRGSGARLAVFCSWMAVSCLLLGSVETYGEAIREKASSIGPLRPVARNLNGDGLRGAAANAVRYAFNNVNLGVEIWRSPDDITPRLEDVCRRVLRASGLGNAGLRPPVDVDSMKFLKTGLDAESDFGPLGTISMGLAAFALFRWRPKELWWRFMAAGSAVFAGISGAILWTPWNVRYLTMPFAAFALGTVSFVYSRERHRSVLSVILLLLSIYCAVAFPLRSFNKRPADLIAAITDRQHEELKEHATMAPVLAAVGEWRADHPRERLLLLAGSSSWILPFFERPELHVEPTTAALLPRVLAGETKRKGALLVLNIERPPDSLAAARVIRRFPEEPGTVFYDLASDRGSR
jgi:hypothetical protein